MQASVLPPRLVAQLEAMPEAELEARLLVLIARYAKKAYDLDPSTWLDAQQIHLSRCIDELETMLPKGR